MSEKIEIKYNTMDIKKSVRIPVAPPTKTFKDKKKYSRKNKHKSSYQL